MNDATKRASKFWTVSPLFVAYLARSRRTSSVERAWSTVVSVELGAG